MRSAKLLKEIQQKNKAVVRRIASLLPFPSRMACSSSCTLYLYIFYTFLNKGRLKDSQLIVRFSDHPPLNDRNALEIAICDDVTAGLDYSAYVDAAINSIIHTVLDRVALCR